jgi:hypothetical protein
MVVQIDNECGSALLISPSLVESVRAYADALDQHKVPHPPAFFAAPLH